MLALIAGVALLAVLGSARYGGPANLRRRLEAEVAARRPHPAFVPTPLPTPVPPTSTATARSLTAPKAPKPADPTALPAPRAEVRPESPTAVQVKALPTATASPSPPPTLTALPSPSPQLPTQVRLTGLDHWWQTWNNCGPATLAMNLSYYGSRAGQAEVAAALRPDPDDKNVTPEEMAAYARSLGFGALVRVNGDAERLRQLLAAGIPVLIETWHEPEPGNGMGHYRLLVGYDDPAGEWIAYDSYDARGVSRDGPYSGIRLPYDELGWLWDVFNRVYLVVFPPDQAPALEAILGPDLADAAMWERARLQALEVTRSAPENPFGWFNLGSDLVAMSRYGEAAEAYDQARQVGLPWRMLWYQFGPFAAYQHVGRHEEVIALANATLRTADNIEELYYWRGLAQRSLGDSEAAQASWRRALALNPNMASLITPAP